jgi:predicted GNAT family acetyltransferase
VSTPEHEVIHNSAHSRFEVKVGGDVVGYALFERVGSTVTFTHTVVERQWEGSGLGTELAARAVASIREQGHQLVARCSFIRAYVEAHEGQPGRA